MPFYGAINRYRLYRNEARNILVSGGSRIFVWGRQFGLGGGGGDRSDGTTVCGRKFRKIGLACPK